MMQFKRIDKVYWILCEAAKDIEEGDYLSVKKMIATAQSELLEIKKEDDKSEDEIHSKSGLAGCIFFLTFMMIVVFVVCLTIIKLA